MNSVIHKQTLTSPSRVSKRDARVLPEVNGVLTSFDPEIKRQIIDNLNNFFASGCASYCGRKRDF